MRKIIVFAFVAFVFAFVAPVASAAPMDLMVQSADCVRLVNFPDAVKGHSFNSFGKSYKAVVLGACYKPHWDEDGEAVIKVKIFGVDGRKLGGFSKTLTKPGRAVSIEEMRTRLNRCESNLATCERAKSPKAKARGGKAWWQVRKNCASKRAKKLGLTRWNSIRKYCDCEEGFGWVGDKSGKCGRGGVPLVPGKVPAGVAAKSLEDLFGRVERLEGEMIKVKGTLKTHNDELARHGVEIKQFQIDQRSTNDRLGKVEKRVDDLEKRGPTKADHKHEKSVNVRAFTGLHFLKGSATQTWFLLGAQAIWKAESYMDLYAGAAAGLASGKDPSVIGSSGVQFFPASGNWGVDVGARLGFYQLSNKADASGGKSILGTVGAVFRWKAIRGSCGILAGKDYSPAGHGGAIGLECGIGGEF